MNKLGVFDLPLLLGSAILGSNFGVLSPAWGQVNPVSTTLTETDTTFNSSEDILELNRDYELLSELQQYSQTESDPAVESFPRVDSLQDVTPEDWAYDALLTLVNNYRCLAGDEDDTWRGNSSLTRYEFAAALSSCLEKVETLIAANLNLATEEDLASIERLIKEFDAELATVKNNVSDLEERTAFVENHNFSTTTTMRGRVRFDFNYILGGRKAVPSGQTPTEDLDVVPHFTDEVRLNLNTSFTGKDQLLVRLEAGNNTGLSTALTGTGMTFLSNAFNSSDNDLRLKKLFYRFPLGDRGSAYLATVFQTASDFVPTLNLAWSISLFGFNNPIYDIGFGAGGGAYYQFSDLIGAGLSYYAGSTNSPESGKGLFNGDFAALSQITLTPSERWSLALTYAHYYSPEPVLTNNLTSFLGSQFAQFPFGSSTATSSDNFNIAASYKVSDRLRLASWIGYSHAVAQSSPLINGLNGFEGSDADIWTWAVTASYNDLGKLGSNLSFIFGMPPKLTNNDITGREDRDTSYHLELSYRYPITDRIWITSGGFLIFNPEHNAENDHIWVGLIRLQLDI
ncbi:MAG: carbohydrate porin [Symploca sp. SIO2C1]|nr:carbohydrate porin [Symploca sp. SIO2C1]